MFVFNIRKRGVSNSTIFQPLHLLYLNCIATDLLDLDPLVSKPSTQLINSPPKVVKSWFFVPCTIIKRDGSVLVGCSELTGRYWNGGANIRNSVEELQKELINGTKLGIQLITGTADGCFIDTDKVLLCEDSGAVGIWSYVDNSWSQWEEVKLGEHDDVVMAVDSLQNGKLYVTVGLDANIKVWDVEEFLCVQDYRAAHSLGISGVSVKPNSTKNFITCSYDRLVCLWDYDKDVPVLDVAKSDSGVRCVQWLDENWLVFGDDSGVLSSVDLRQPGNSVPLLTFPNSVHRVTIQNG
ncbi:Methylosome protein 50 [Eumeta japonica]|uniref:Methylosome protein 50 n=1 Tax=Eumeta variegata TaxID=151549 RepID=A0A4C1XAB8_EUMVA|nr:Methylosome protein 50 [Eumeta japonica]